MNQPCLKLTSYFGERQRVVADHVRRPRFLADAMLDLFDTRGVATSVMPRGIWGFHGDQDPHGDKLFQLTRRVPVVTIIIDTPEWIERSFDIVHELTADHGLVTSEMVPAVVSIAGRGRDGDTRLARHHY